jgi:hypothetical protein
MDDTQLQELLSSGNALSDRMCMDGRYMESAVVSGLVQACRALRTKLTPIEDKSSAVPGS